MSLEEESIRRLQRPKKTVAQVHRYRKSDHEAGVYKTFSDGFDAKKSKYNKAYVDDTEEIHKPSRKFLIKEYQELQSKLEESQGKVEEKEAKIQKLKEKVSGLQAINKEILDENEFIKEQFENIAADLQQYKTQVALKLKCDQCEEMRTGLEMLKEEEEKSRNKNEELVLDLNMLKNVIYRLNVQLERYQDKYRKRTASQESLVAEQQFLSSANHADHSHTPISWGNVNTHTLGPLLDAYQDTVAEKEEIIQKHEKELENFTGRLKEIIEENGTLHKNLVSEADQNVKLNSELQKIREEFGNVKQQNAALEKKCSARQDKLQDILTVYQQKVDSLSRDYDLLQEQYHKTRGDLCATQGKHRALQESYETLKADRETQVPLSVHTSSVNECKRLFEELKSQYDSEKIKLTKELEDLQKKLPDTENRIVAALEAKQEAELAAKVAEKQAKKCEQRCKELKNSLTHTEVSRESCKRQLAKVMVFARELVAEQETLLSQLSDKHRESKAAKKLGAALASRMDHLKINLKTVQKDAYHELLSVEEKIKAQDGDLETLRQELKQKEHLINHLQNQITPPLAPFLMYRDKNGTTP